MSNGWTDERRAKQATRMKARNADPEFKARHAAKMKARHADPEHKAKLTALSKTRWADPECRKRLTDAMALGRSKRQGSDVRAHEKALR